MRIALALVLIAAAALAADSGWTAYGGNAGGTRYAPETGHARKRRQTAARLDLSHRRAQARDRAQREGGFRSDAHPGRRHALPHHAVQPRHRARSRDRRREVELRSAGRPLPRLFGGDLPRCRGLDRLQGCRERAVQAAHLRRHDRRAACSRSTARPASPARFRRRRARSISRTASIYGPEFRGSTK